MNSGLVAQLCNAKGRDQDLSNNCILLFTVNHLCVDLKTTRKRCTNETA